jgi:hypothetical protein
LIHFNIPFFKKYYRRRIYVNLIGSRISVKTQEMAFKVFIAQAFVRMQGASSGEYGRIIAWSNRTAKLQLPISISISIGTSDPFSQMRFPHMGYPWGGRRRI